MESDDELDEVVKKVEDGDADFVDYPLALLARFQKLYREAHEIQRMTAKRTDELRDKTLTAEGAQLIAFAARWRPLVIQLEEVHHMLGHVHFDQCWQDVDVGDEFEPQQNLLGELAELLQRSAPPGVTVEAGVAESVEELASKIGADLARAANAKMHRDSGPMPEIN